MQGDALARAFKGLTTAPIEVTGMSDATRGSERRAAQRYECPGIAEIVLPGRGLHYAGKIGNLSVGGCFIEARCGLERGTAVEVWMNAEGQPLRVAANLMVRRTTGVGVRFLGLTERKAQQIRSLIAELAAEESLSRADSADDQTAGPQAEAAPEVFSRHAHEARSLRRPNWLVRLTRRLGMRRRRR
jgi:hypothetical protein